MARHLNAICRSAVPPCSVQAWIPKAKMGPTADNFRLLGMPSTFERIIDGSIATVMTKAIAPLLHPSQTVLNYFGNHKVLYNRSNLPLTTTRHVHVSLWTYLKHSSGLTHIGSSYRSSQRVKHPCGLSCIPDIFFFSEDVGTRCKANCYPRK